ncbi:vacuolar iron transporter homolog 5-like [Actinidia eriantha]|uniref:vacuolar iron transporter homolog 5-like n=1 Tax=Actinidia eriantha TaxID=165200 RepID=UPI0025893357|nr:vacuolar iron transporter homolog 5-like [Actinidia eriantha]
MNMWALNEIIVYNIQVTRARLVIGLIKARLRLVRLINKKLEACAEHKEERKKQIQRAQWLRAAILGANDGLLSTTALMLGVGAAKEDRQSMILSGLAGAFAGACSMAVGEFVSVATQRDIEKATISNSTSKNELYKQDNGGEIRLHIENGTSIFENKPIDTNLVVSPVFMTPSLTIPCKKVIDEGDPSRIVSPAMTPEIRRSPLVLSYPKSPLMKVIEADAKAAIVKGENEDEDEKEALPNPYKAAAASALAFLCGSVVPLLPAALIAHSTRLIVVIVVLSSIAMVLFGGIGAYLGGSSVKISAVRVLLGGWITMGITYGLLKPLDKDRKGDT